MNQAKFLDSSRLTQWAVPIHLATGFIGNGIDMLVKLIKQMLLAFLGTTAILNPSQRRNTAHRR
jgi:hypothetical protein